MTRRVADGGPSIPLPGTPECATGVDILPETGSVFSPSRDRTTPNPSGPPALVPRLAPSPVLVLPLRGGAGPFPTMGGGAIEPGVWTPGISGVCSPPCIIMLPHNEAEAGVANDSAPLPPCTPAIGVACIELLLCGPVHGVAGALAPNMLEFTSGVAADMGVPGNAPIAPGVAVTPASIDTLGRPMPWTVLLLQGARAVKGAALLPLPKPNASCACPSACAISASLKYSLSSSSAPK